jgi:serine protease Do
VFAVAASAACRPKEEAPAEPAPVVAPTEPLPSTDSVKFVYPAAPGSFVDIADDVQRGIVSIRSTRKVLGGPAEDFPGIDDPFALGTGFLVDSSGYILTTDTVVANAPEVRVVLYDGVERAATVAGRDPKLNLALLSIEASPKLRPLTLGNSEQTQVGEWVIAVGNPFGLGASVSAGIVSFKGELPIGPKGEYQRTYLHTDASVHSGNSGGPLLNMQGDVIGINVAEKSRDAAVGYAIPIDRAKQVLPMLKTDGVVSRAWLGAFVKPVTPELARQLQLERPMGAFVSSVVDNGPAKRAGIERGDVILKYDQRDVDEKSLAWIASTTGIGRPVRVVIWRKGGKRNLEFVTEKMPE